MTRQVMHSRYQLLRASQLNSLHITNSRTGCVNCLLLLLLLGKMLLPRSRSLVFHLLQRSRWQIRLVRILQRLSA